jgi:hypothetical protein
MSAERQIEREERALEQQLASGEISLQEYNAEMRELQRDYQAAAEEAARDAYNRELENW